MPGRLDRSLIRNLPLFASMSEQDLHAVLDAASARPLAKGAAAFDQGEPAGEFFALLHGRLKVVQTSAEGQQVVVRHIGPGDIFGIAKAMRRDTYPASAIAVVESIALAWPSEQWENLVSRNAALAMRALETVGQRLQDAHSRIMELSTEEVERRVAHALLRLVQQAGRKTGDGVVIDFPVTRQDLAELSGSTLHTVSRVMTAWEARGLVASARKRITVRDAAGLRAVADSERAK